MLSFGFGVTLAIAVDFFDQKLWTPTEVEKLLGVPVLIEIPEIVTEADFQSRKRQRLRYLLLSFVFRGSKLNGINVTGKYIITYSLIFSSTGIPYPLLE